MNAIEYALLAVKAADSGDTTRAIEQLSRARHCARTTARRERQIVQIAALVVSGAHDRAAGLTLEHTAEFPDDANLLTRASPAAVDEAADFLGWPARPPVRTRPARPAL